MLLPLNVLDMDFSFCMQGSLTEAVYTGGGTVCECMGEYTVG